MAGLKGFWGRMFQRAARAMAQVVVIAVAGPVAGGIIAAIIQASWTIPDQGRGTFNAYVDNKVDTWVDVVFIPYYKLFLSRVSSNNTNSLQYITKFNGIIEELYAWKAYYEFLAQKETDEDEQLIASEKSGFIGDYITIVQNVWLKNKTNPTLNFYPKDFNPIVYNKIGNENLDWRGAKSITAQTYTITDKSSGGLPNGGTTTGAGTTTPGGTKHLNPGGATSTGGGSTTGGNNTSGGGATNNGNGGGSVTIPPPTPKTKPPTKTLPSNTNDNKTPEEKGNNNKIWLIGIGIAALAIFTKKK